MIGCENSHNISEYKNEKIPAVSRSGIDPNKGTFDCVDGFEEGTLEAPSSSWCLHSIAIFTGIESHRASVSRSDIQLMWTDECNVDNGRR